MSILRIALLVALTALAVACDNVPGWVKPDARDLSRGMRIALRPDCLLHSTPRSGTESAATVVSGLIVAVAPVVVDKTFDLVSNLLKARAEAFQGSVTARGAARFYDRVVGGQPHDRRPANRCIVITHGHFGSTPIADKPVEKPWSAETLKELGVTQIPDFYFEGALEYEPPFFRVVPVFLEYGRPIAERVGWKGVKDLVITVGLEVPVSMNEGGLTRIVGAATLTFLRLPVPSRLQSADLAGMTSQWLPMPPMAAKTTAFKNSKAVEDYVRHFGPVSLLATIADSDKGGDILLRLSTAVTDAKKPVTEEITRSMTPKDSSKR